MEPQRAEKMDRHLGKPQKLEVFYWGELDTALDDSIKLCFEAMGYDFTGSGYDFEGGKRDLSFAKPPMQVA